MRHSKRSLEGELFIDHRASPGLRPEDIGGTFGTTPAVAKGEIFESPVVVCAHCQYVVVLLPNRSRERGWCAQCDKYLCDACTEKRHLTLTCDNFTRRVEQQAQNEVESYGSTQLLLSDRTR